MRVSSFKDLDILMKSEGVELKEQVVSYDVADSDISGGRKIVDAKSNQSVDSYM